MSKQIFDQHEFILLSGQDQLSVYHWGDKDVNHFFCRKCGIYPFHSTVEQPEGYRINLLCIDGLDLSTLDVMHFDGKNLL